MRNIAVIKHLFVLGIISIILNSMFIMNFFGGYISIVVFYRYFIIDNFARFAVAFESIGVFATVACTVLTLVGSSLAVSPNKKTRVAGLVLSLVSICILLIHFIVNIIFLALTLSSYLSFSLNDIFLLVNACVLGPLVLFQLILLIYNSIFICIVGCSLRQEEDE